MRHNQRPFNDHNEVAPKRLFVYVSGISCPVASGQGHFTFQWSFLWTQRC